MIVDVINKSGELRLGSSGEAVKQVQLALAKLGYPLKGTGYFGPATDTAVSAFQKRVALKADGEIGPLTAKAIDEVGSLWVLPPHTVAEVSRPLWVEAGLKLLGTHEGVGSKDNALLIDWAKEEGGDISHVYTHDSIPWCSLFANHIMSKVGIKGTETLWALDWRGKWPSIKLDGPAVGAMAPMTRNGGGHITCVVGKDQHGNIMGLGGNQSDAVTIAPFAVSRLNQGYWWPSSVSAPAKTGMSSLPIVTSDGKVSKET